ncbi:MAG TPA: lysylphosphatidylglycerol synthase transmembrane domain-containing protein [Candidatus Acidoferrales bacterium]|nr:lysylphosphatidylglycerol synthase transmembrane domain-containing protein [Candidatus Acidoferrales bacterium]
MRRIVRNLILLAITVGLLGALLYHWRRSIAKQGFSWTVLEHSVRQARLSLVLAAVVLVFVCYFIRAQRWMCFSRHLGRTRYRTVLQGTLMGFAAVFLLGRAGEPVRPVLIARRDRLPISGEIGIYVLERIFDIAATLALFGSGLLLATRQLADTGDDTAVTTARGVGLVMLVFLLAMIGFLIYFRLHGAGQLQRRLEVWRAGKGWRHRMAEWFAGFGEGLQAIRGPRDLIEAIAYSVVHWVLVALVVLWVCRSFGGDLGQLGFADAMLVLGVSMLGGMVQLPAVGGGAQAATFFALTAFFGIEQEPAFAAAIVLWLVTFAAVVPVGVPLFIRQGLSVHELWELASESKRERILAEGGGGFGKQPEERVRR